MAQHNFSSQTPSWVCLRGWESRDIFSRVKNVRRKTVSRGGGWPGLFIRIWLAGFRYFFDETYSAAVRPFEHALRSCRRTTTNIWSGGWREWYWVCWDDGSLGQDLVEVGAHSMSMMVSDARPEHLLACLAERPVVDPLPWITGMKEENVVLGLSEKFY